MSYAIAVISGIVTVTLVFCVAFVLIVLEDDDK